MDEVHVAKATVLQKLDGLIAEEKTFVEAAMVRTEEGIRRSLRVLRDAAMAGETEPGRHLGALLELRRRLGHDAREAIPLSHRDYARIMDGVGGGKSRLLRAQAKEEIARLNQLFGAAGFPKLPPSFEEAILRNYECDVPDCPVHGKTGILSRLGLRSLLALGKEDSEPVGKLGVQDDVDEASEPASEGAGADETAKQPSPA